MDGADVLAIDWMGAPGRGIIRIAWVYGGGVIVYDEGVVAGAAERDENIRRGSRCDDELVVRLTLGLGASTSLPFALRSSGAREATGDKCTLEPGM